MPRGTEGTLYRATCGETLKQIAVRIRNDLALAIRGGMLPSGTRTSVRMRHHTSLDVTLTIPFKTRRDNVSAYARHSETVTPEAQCAQQVTQTICDQYNYDNSDAMTDYFDVRFYDHVRVEASEPFRDPSEYTYCVQRLARAAAEQAERDRAYDAQQALERAQRKLRIVLAVPAPQAPAHVPGTLAIRFTWSESTEINDTRIFATFQEAEAHLARAGAARAAESREHIGGYYKTGFSVTWPSGEEYEGRYDIGSDQPTLTEHIRVFNTSLLEGDRAAEWINAMASGDATRADEIRTAARDALRALAECLAREALLVECAQRDASACEPAAVTVLAPTEPPSAPTPDQIVFLSMLGLV